MESASKCSSFNTHQVHGENAVNIMGSAVTQCLWQHELHGLMKHDASFESTRLILDHMNKAG